MKSQWKPPKGPNVKVNFDAVFKPNLRQSWLGFVIKNKAGLVLGSGVRRNTYVATAFSAEALACVQALEFAMKMGFQHIEMEGDSRTTIVKAQKCALDRPEIGIHIEEIKRLATKFHFIYFQYVDTEANGVAHTIAKAGFPLTENHFWVEEVPKSAMDVVNRDRWLLGFPD
ncbi:hypothetical protein Gogos_021786 [Gossypium gossypioides]|uniref:RNase H type-1 domain-containing protein n=1 Tax=Gossypium gossypioides TaxID=34282 RepID=A0A7J9CXY0_GOSGO|nr:hypothetical protein [Gossypium gossypioides]